jgi:hypothetical protein
MKPKSLWTLIAALFALYVPTVYLLDARYDPNDGGPPGWAGTRVRIDPPYQSMSSIAVTKEDQGGIFETLDLTKIELWEGNQKLGPDNSTINEIVSLGEGRFLFEAPHRIIWSSSDNSDPMTNGRAYWVVNPSRAKGRP